MAERLLTQLDINITSLGVTPHSFGKIGNCNIGEEGARVGRVGTTLLQLSNMVTDKEHCRNDSFFLLLTIRSNYIQNK
jgi:hypothetical protein